MTYCPKCKKWRADFTTMHSSEVHGHVRFVKQCRKCGTRFVPNGKKSIVYVEQIAGA